MKILPVFCVPLAELQRLRHPRLVDIVAVPAGLPLDAKSHQPGLHPSGQQVLILDRMEDRRVLGPQARQFDLRRMGVPLYGVAVGFCEGNLKRQVRSRVFHFEMVHSFLLSHIMT